MDNTQDKTIVRKPFWKSKRFWGIVATTIGTGLLKFNIFPYSQAVGFAFWVFGTVLALYGSAVAQSPWSIKEESVSDEEDLSLRKINTLHKYFDTVDVLKLYLLLDKKQFDDILNLGKQLQTVKAKKEIGVVNGAIKLTLYSDNVSETYKGIDKIEIPSYISLEIKEVDNVSN